MGNIVNTHIPVRYFKGNVFNVIATMTITLFLNTIVSFFQEMKM